LPSKPNLVLVFFKRSKYSATDTAPTEIVISEVLEKYREANYACLIQATSPFLKSKDIVKAFKNFKKKNFDSMFSGYIFKKFLWVKKRVLTPLNYDLFKRPMRQKICKFYIENGAFYFFNVKKYLFYKNRLFGKIGCFEMSYNDSIDIDTKKDFNNAQKKLKY
jgi:CMP-N-acetylneuraminic acid synthetase